MIENSLGVQNTSEYLDPQLQNYQHKFILKQYMCGMISTSYTQTTKLL